MGTSFKNSERKEKEYRAIAEGVQSLLRENIVANYNKYQDRGNCPIYAKESLKHVYEAYYSLGGNGRTDIFCLSCGNRRVGEIV